MRCSVMFGVSGMLVKILLSAVLLTLFCGAAFAQSGDMDKAKHGILLVAFGSSVPEGEAAVTAMEHAVKSAYPGVEVRVAYTSRIIMRKLAREQSRTVDEPAIALAKMAYEGFTDVAVLSTHIIPGAEYQDLEAVVDAFKLMYERGTKAGFDFISLSNPLLADGHDFERLAQVLENAYAKEIKEGAVVFVGHGTHHFADAAYDALQTALWRKSPGFFVGTVEGSPSFDDVLGQLKRTKNRKITLAPAMLVAGDHAQNDIAGDEEDSWKEMLTAEGYQVSARLRGLGQIEGVQRLFIDKLREAWGDNAPR